jgi:hypothetical protein
MTPRSNGDACHGRRTTPCIGTAEAALGYDREAVSYGMGDAQRFRQSTDTAAFDGGHYAFLEAARPQHYIEAPQRAALI